ncbi:nuclear transport factor 2 family protein [Pseudanabaena biceps]|nr:nuclear transport factor 2 family protein [Pseudanabaena biceps]
MKDISSNNIDLFINIDGINELTIYEYFAGLNNNEFMATSELFAEQGCLNPPFEQTVCGRDAIAQYLEKEAKGIEFCPAYGEMIKSDNAFTQYQIQGKVKTNQFTVNVNWLIQLNSAKEILLVEVKLIASLIELLNFNNSIILL